MLPIRVFQCNWPKKEIFQRVALVFYGNYDVFIKKRVLTILQVIASFVFRAV